VIAALAAATWPKDPSALGLTGAPHMATASALTAHSLLYLARRRLFAGSGYDLGYLTTAPGIRGEMFHGRRPPANSAKQTWAKRNSAPRKYGPSGLQF
jgi:hypothetical protein